MSTFRFQARYALLTYAQCGDLDPFAVVNHLAGLGAECIIGREDHADGGIHLHAFVDFGVKYRSRNSRAFDVEGHHPNVSPSRGTPEEGFDYAIKDGDVVAGGLERPIGGRVDAAGGVWPEIINAKSESEFWSLCESLAPRSLVTSFTQLRAYAAWKFPPIRIPYETPEGVNIDTSWVAELDGWVRENLGRGTSGGKKSLVVYGPSRMGKTIWARSLGRHAYFGGLFSMDEDVDGAEYAIFDDFGGIKFLPSYKFWLGHQKEFYVTDKYKGKKLVHWARPSIWLSNSDPRDELGVDTDWLNANCDFVYLDSPIVS
uniref:Replication-associated protein n=1 Tax=Genomoviridae sp. TaxID=2202565 RepID=A0A858NFT0_9VIRU|nr:MAG: replication-associated protein [Genomoviridae sp.]